MSASVNEKLTALADEIRIRGGGEGKLTLDDMRDRILDVWCTGYEQGCWEGETDGYYNGYGEGYGAGYNDGIDVGRNEAIEEICPPFTESGSIVTCEPVADFPLTVYAEEGATTIIRTGKNVFGGKALLDALVSKDTGGGVTLDEANQTVTFDPGKMTRTGHLFNKFKENTQYTIILYGYNTVAAGVTNITLQYTDETLEYIYFNNGKLGKDCPANELGYVICTTKADKTPWRLRLQWANGLTFLHYNRCGIFEGVVSVEGFEAYNGNTFYPHESFPGLAGVNNIWADSGNVEVTGRADPIAIINKLTNALGSNV